MQSPPKRQIGCSNHLEDAILKQKCLNSSRIRTFFHLNHFVEYLDVLIKLQYFLMNDLLVSSNAAILASSSGSSEDSIINARRLSSAFN